MILITLFNELMEEYPAYRSYIPNMTEEMVRRVVSKLAMRVNTQTIVDLVMDRYELIQK